MELEGMVAHRGCAKCPRGAHCQRVRLHVEKGKTKHFHGRVGGGCELGHQHPGPGPQRGLLRAGAGGRRSGGGQAELREDKGHWSPQPMPLQEAGI